jgi:hypothetical protein
MVAKGKSLCKGKSVKNPNRCKKIHGCKVAKGTKRSYCRKKHNRTAKRRSPTLAEKYSARQRRLNRELKRLSPGVRHLNNRYKKVQ